jgi:hypothetical protein
VEQEISSEYKKFSLFNSPDERTPIEPVHVQEAFRRLQRSEATASSIYSNESVRNHSGFAMRNFCGGRLRSKVTLI